LQGSKGASQLNIGDAAIELIVNDVGCVMDIDTVSDLERARGLLGLGETRG
jgi:molybdenum cofactor cytidylyltransferase